MYSFSECRQTILATKFSRRIFYEQQLSEQSVQPEEPEQSEQSEEPEQSEQPEESEQPEQPEESEQPEQQPEQITGL
jgi:hypothetical protein